MLFSSRPEYGHRCPLMPLAFAAREAGHDVVFASGEEVLPRLRALDFQAYQAGISIVEAARELRRTLPDLPSDDLEFHAELFGAALPRRTALKLMPLLDEIRPDLVVYDYYDLGAGVAAGLAGVPAACHSLGMAWPSQWRELAAGRIEDLWNAFAMPSAPLDVFLGNAYLDVCPPSLQQPSTLAAPERIPMRPIPWSEPAGPVPDWATGTRTRPLVYLTLGTAFYGDGSVHRAVVEGLSTQDVDVIVHVGPSIDPAVLGPVSDHVHVERFVPQAQLLPHVDLVVHHGGNGVMLGALSAGKPQLALPQGADQFGNAEALVSAGPARSLLPDEVTPDAVAAVADVLLSDSVYRGAAERVSREIATIPHPRDVLPALVAPATRRVDQRQGA
jgi:UDP:flavonoid glycosyltransferase YjiC (YdhE family)